MAVKYTVYEMLREMINRTGWQTEEMKNDMLNTLSEAENMNALGIISTILACSHPADRRGNTGIRTQARYGGGYYDTPGDDICLECGRIFK